MSKILKRPMFRKGGAANEGIMSMAQPRKNYQQGTNIYERLKKFDPSLGATAEKYGTAYELAMGLDKEQDKNDILARVLIEGGLSGLSGKGAGRGTIGGLAESFREPVSKGLAEYSAMKKEPSQARLMGVKSAIETDAAARIAAAKAKTGFAAQLPEEQIKADAAGISKSIESRALPSAIYNDPYGTAQKFYEGRMRFGNKFVRVPKFIRSKGGEYAINPSSMKIGEITYIPGRGFIEKVTDSPNPNQAFRPYSPKDSKE
jgi:hypothetical protein